MFTTPYNSATVVQMTKAVVPITRFNKGEAGKIIEEVKQDGVRIIVKNNVPECVMITVEEYIRLTEAANHPARLIQTKEAEEKRKAFITKIRANVQPPLEPSISPEKRKEIMDSIGPIQIDEEAVNELRRLCIQ